jgi:3-hydroxybutyryl-CoA dehydratase
VSRVVSDPAERYYEDFQEGDTIRTRGRTVEASDLLAFAGLVGNYYPLHIDKEFGADTRFQSRLAHGSFTLSVAIGLVGMTGYLGDAVVAQLALNDVRATGPVRPGDTLSVVAVVVACNADEESHHGRVDISYSVRNQRDETVMSFEQGMLVRRRKAAS